jgi:hypothetical protein
VKINLRQEIAMWVLGLAWTVLALNAWGRMQPSLGDILTVLVLLVPMCLIVFSLRERKKPN